MIACCGLPTRVPDARPSAELAGATRPIRFSQGRRDPRAAPRGRRAAPTQPTPDPELGRPRRAQRAEPAAAHPVAPAAARLTPNPAALARPTRRPPLDPPRTPTRPPANLPTDPGPGTADGPREPDLGLPTHPRRAGRTRPPDRRLHRVDDPEDPAESTRPRSGPDRPGNSSSPPKPRRSSPSTSPTSTRSSCAASTS
jgi:hypothetical protein